MIREQVTHHEEEDDEDDLSVNGGGGGNGKAGLRAKKGSNHLIQDRNRLGVGSGLPVYPNGGGGGGGYPKNSIPQTAQSLDSTTTMSPPNMNEMSPSEFPAPNRGGGSQQVNIANRVKSQRVSHSLTG